MVAFSRILLSLSVILVEIASASRCSPAFIDKPDWLGLLFSIFKPRKPTTFPVSALA
jgi:hypothetical protein